MRADAPPVVILPGFLAGDWTTRPLHAALRRAGLRTFGWKLGWNRGARADLIERLDARIEAIIAHTGERPALVGWSLGGIYAREYAKHHPAKVARVITLGSPFSGSRRANHAWRLYGWVAGHSVDAPPIALHPDARPAVPTFALWSPRDGVVAAASARGLASESDRQVEVACGHMDFAYARPAVAAIITAVTADAASP